MDIQELYDKIYTYLRSHLSVYLAGNYELYSTGTIDCSGLQTTTLYSVL